MIPPDNKLVEDCHTYLRDLARHMRANVSSLSSRASAAVNSGRLEVRGIEHEPITHDEFISKYGAPAYKKRKLGNTFMSKQFQLPADISALMGERTWKSPSPESSKVGVTAWLWYKRWVAMTDEERRRIPHDGAWITRLVPPFSVIWNLETDRLLYTMKPCKYLVPCLNMVDTKCPLGGDQSVTVFTFDFASGMTELCV